MFDDALLSLKVAARFESPSQRTGYKYEPKETKENKVDRLTKTIREATGLSRGVSESIADAIVRGREVARLAIQKGWPIEDGVLEGPSGTLSLEAVKVAARTIQFDKTRVLALADHLVDKAFEVLGKVSYEGWPIREHASIVGDSLKLKNVKGIEQDIMVVIASRKGNGRLPTAGGNFKKTGYDNAGEIYLFLDSTWTLEALKQGEHDVRKLIRSNLIHEVTHALDIINQDAEYQGSDSDPDKAKKYFNQPLELRAYAKQIVEEVLLSVKVLRLQYRRLHKPLPTGGSLITDLLDESRSWNKIEQFLTQASKALIYKIVVRELQDEGVPV